MSPPAEAPRHAAVVMNPRSGGGKVARFRLDEAAERLGAEVLLTGPDEDAVVLARRAVEGGADVLGVAAGDGTVSTVAAVAVEAGLPLLVIPAGTRNHFARDLGLDIRDPAAALAALHGEDAVLVDLGVVNGRILVNNVSLGLYAEALLNPDYREAKGHALASVAGPYLGGRQWVDAGVDTPDGTVEHPQVVLVSNNRYHIATPRYVGRRFALDRGALGAIVVKRTPGAAPEPLPRLVEAMVEHGGDDEGLITWSSPSVTLHGTAATVAAGVDGEAVSLALPALCEIRPRALRVLLPKDRPGLPAEPQPPQPPRPPDGPRRRTG